ncbi:MAG: hypothetical protein K6B46_05615 [Opitutales bacterium]|nr:hypothetical protein [Opitutales bacterium]
MIHDHKTHEETFFEKIKSFLSRRRPAYDDVFNPDEDVPASATHPEEEEVDESEIGREPGMLPEESPFENADEVRFRVISYTSEEFTLDEFEDIDKLPIFAEKKDGVVWVQVMGLREPEVVKLVGAIFGIPPLAQEDVLNQWSRPKFEEYGDDIIMAITRAVRLNDLEELQPKGQQIAFVAGGHFLVSFHEKRERIFENIEKRIATNSGKIRNWGSPYLLYVLVDALVDRILVLTEEIEDSISELEDNAIEANDNDKGGEDIRSIYHLKRLVIRLGRMIKPLSGMVHKLRTIDHPLLPKEMDMYFDDLDDHAQRSFDRLDHSRNVLQELQDFYQNEHNRRTNEIIRLLTTITFFFIPITFVTGFFGMNFNFPAWLSGSVWLLVVAVFCAVFIAASIFFFKKKKWF